jgi:Ca-activated chloride channel homolog
MRRSVAVLTVLLAWAGAAHAKGLLIPEEKTLPPLAMLNHKVSITIEDQVAVTKVEQTFRNHTDRPLEATYLFPVPKGAAVNQFAMWVDGKEVKGELVEAAKARDIYTSIVRRTQDPGLLEYLDHNLFRLRVFPVPAKGDQKVALSYTALMPREADLVEYVYPLKTDGKATATLEDFSIEATVKSQHGVQNVYSPTHAVTLKRTNDNEVAVHFERSQGLLDKDFQLFYQLGNKDVGLTALTHRPVGSEDGYFLLLLTPKADLSHKDEVPRDMVFVLDTSGSMRQPESNPKIDQAKKALKFCLQNLGPKDRFGMLHFATTVNKYRDGLLDANPDQVGEAVKWVEKLGTTGGTAINDALAAALAMRTNDPGRTFTIVFFTDGQPTIGETNPDKILKNVAAKNTASTRIFTLGVGDDVNATMLDQLAEQTRAVATYVRPAEDISAKVAGLYAKISHPVLTDLKLSATNDITFSEVYPAQLPDLFHGQQLVVLGRWSGKGPAAIRLTGAVGMESKEFVYELTFPEKTGSDRAFVEEIWARRKVGFLLDQIRANGEKKELVDEVVALAKKYGITTPYTSYLIVPDAPVAAARAPDLPPPSLAPTGQHVSGVFRGTTAPRSNSAPGTPVFCPPVAAPAYAHPATVPAPTALDPLQQRPGDLQTGKLGVEFAVQLAELRNQSRVAAKAVRQAAGRTCLEVGGVWIDEGFDAKMATCVVKAQSDAYFRILEKNPKMKEVFRLGNYLVFVTPSKIALIIDSNDGKDKLSDEEIDKLFVAKK